MKRDAIKLSKILEVVGYPEGFVEWYIDLSTLGFVSVDGTECLSDFDYDFDPDEYDEDPNLIPVPSASDVHKWQIMRNFSDVQEEEARTELMDAIHGAGAFRNFRRVTEELGLTDAWYAVEQITRDWLIENEIPFTED